jgi:hypothetical protein
VVEFFDVAFGALVGVEGHYLLLKLGLTRCGYRSIEE